MSQVVDAVAGIAQGQVPAGRVAFIWTVHEGIRGATELQVLGDGTVTEGPMGGDPTLTGRVPLEDVHGLAAVLERCRFHEIKPTGPPRPGATTITLDVQALGEGVRIEVPSSQASVAGLDPIREAFLALRKRASQPSAPAVPPPAAATPASAPTPAMPATPVSKLPRQVVLAGRYWTMMGCMAPLTFGLTLFIGWWSARSFPREYDDEGLTTRAGKRYRWPELRQVPIVNANRPGVVLGYHLAGPDDSLVRLAPFSFVDGKAVCDEILSRAWKE